MKDHEIKITDIAGNENYIFINWQGNIGFGTYTIGIEDGKLVGMSEFMDKGENKDFLREILEALVKEVEVIE